MDSARQPAAISTLRPQNLISGFSCLWLFVLGFLLCGILLAPLSAVAAITSITPVTWNVVGLDSNSPLSGPNRFPIGARVCSNTGETDYPVHFVWESANVNINLSSRAPLPADEIEIDIPAGGCADAYFEVTVERTFAAFDTARSYYIEAGGLKTPQPRELYVQKLVSQARNGITNLEFGASLASLTSVPAGGSFSLIKGNTYFIRMSSYTAPGGYEQLETFSTLPNTIFQVLSVSTTYTADSTTNVSSPNNMLYGDACYWEEDPDSPNYLACNGDGKIGGTMTVTYEVKIIDVGGGSNPINSLIYDLSGASYHYNSDYDSGGRTVNLVDPAAVTIDKNFIPDPIAAGGTSTLTFTINNSANGGAVTDVGFTDIFPTPMSIPAAPDYMVVASPLTSSNSCGGSLTDNAGNPLAVGAAGIKLAGGSIPGYSSCNIKINVTAPAQGIYTNTSGNAFVGAMNTTDNAMDTLTVDDSYFPPPALPSSCGGGELEMATWSMPTSGQGSGGPPPPYTTKATDVSTASASYSGTGTSSIDPTALTLPGAANSWKVTGGWPAALPVTAYYQFAANSSNYGGAQILFDFYMTGNWANAANNHIYVYSSDDNVTYTQIYTRNPLSKTTWYSVSANAFSTGLTTTYFRIYFVGQQNNTAAINLDNIHIRGCQNPDPPTITKAFSPTTVAVGANSTLTFTVVNPNPSGLSGIAFVDTLPDGVEVATGTSSACNGGTLTSTAPNQLSFASGTLAAPILPATSTSCTIPVTVTATSAGSHDNTSGYVTSTYSGYNTDPINGTAKATLTAVLPPSIEKNFSPTSIFTSAFGGVSTLTFTLSNPNPAYPLAGVSFIDNFPVNVVVATPLVFSTNNCGTPTFSPTAGSGTITFSDGSIAVGATCTVTVNVAAATAGYYENTSEFVKHTINALTWDGNKASDALLVETPTPDIILLKQIGENLTGPWSSFIAVNAGDPLYYRFSVENIGDVTLSSVDVTDPAAWVDPSLCNWSDGDGDALIAPFTLPVADALDNDHIATCIIGPVTAVAGVHDNTATAAGTFVPVTVTDTSTASYATAALTLDKTADKAYFVTPTVGPPPVSDVITYSFTVTNSGAAILSGPVIIADDKTTDEYCPPLNTIGNFNNVFDPTEIIVCTATHTVTAGDITARTITNVATASAGVNAGTTSNSDSVTVLLAPDLIASKSNNTTNDKVVAGESFTWTLSVRNSTVAGDISFAAGTTLLVDNLPPITDATATLAAVKKTGIGGTGTLACSIVINDLTCTASGGTVTIPSTLSGTVAVVNGNPTVNGTGTAFTTDLTAGSIIFLDNVPYTVAAITDNVTLTLTTNYAGVSAPTLQIPASFSVLITVLSKADFSLTYPLALVNPRSGGFCLADPNDVLFEIDDLGNNACSNTVTSRVTPLITVIKTVTPYSDPINGSGVGVARTIPGSFMTYRLEVRNSGLGSVDAGTTVLTDKVPDNAELFVGDVDGAGSPVAFTDTCVTVSLPDPASTGLSFTFAGLDDTGDSLKFSKSITGATYDDPADLPIVSDANGCDSAVKYFRVALSGPFLGKMLSTDNKTTSFCLEYRVRLQ